MHQSQQIVRLPKGIFGLDRGQPRQEFADVAVVDDQWRRSRLGPMRWANSGASTQATACSVDCWLVREGIKDEM
jgi:hypothetical protein